MTSVSQPDPESAAAPLTAPVRFAEARQRSASVAAISLCVSFALHGALLGAVLVRSAVIEAGGAGREPDAIGVELVSSAVFEARFNTASRPTAAAATVVVEQEEGSNADATQAARREQAPAKVVQSEPPPSAEAVEAPSVPETRTPPPDPQPALTAAAAQEAKAQGGAQARGSDGANPSSGAAAASPGAVQRYAGEVHGVLAKIRLQGRGKRGTVSVAFSITNSGDVTLVSVSKSSGEEILDRLAIDAIQRAAFPKPPDGMNAAQMTYVIALHFR